MSFESDFFKELQSSQIDFEAMALKLFRYQAAHVGVYKSFIDLLHINPNKIEHASQIPFLPASFFKTHKIVSDNVDTNFCFSSSTTTGGTPSKHFVPDIKIYEWSFRQAFNHVYNSHTDFCFLGLLPNYLERGGSSLVYMVQHFISDSKYKQSNFYLHDFTALSKQLLENEAQGISTLLIGVTYALLDFAEQFPIPLKNTIVMETGGMKGRREELQRAEVHAILKKAFHLEAIHSEYGMTELLSQAYSKGNGIFTAPPWMQFMACDLNDPRTILPFEKAGSLNIIDLANIYSCAFIATDDLGVVQSNSTFEVLGRKDNSDVRGCGLMYQPG